jgi:4'-phosphopantetheinyl transferase
MVWSAADLRSLDAIRVAPGEIVYAFVSLAGEPSSIDEALLDDEESDRARRFVHRSDRCHYVLAHVSLRLFLARCLGVDPAAVVYERGLHGKPGLGAGLARLQFNQSHSRGLGLLAVACERSLGVDVEQIRDVPEAPGIAETHFSVAERRELRALPPIEQRAAFFRCWTRKEALVKADGKGLGHALDSFDVDLAPGSTSALKRYAGRPGDESGWVVRDLPSPRGYAAAGAIAAPPDGPPRWREL